MIFIFIICLEFSIYKLRKPHLKLGRKKHGIIDLKLNIYLTFVYTIFHIRFLHEKYLIDIPYRKECFEM